MAVVDRYLCDNPGCGAVVYMEQRYRVRDPHCVRCRASLSQHGTARLETGVGGTPAAPCAICGEAGKAQEHAPECPYAGQLAKHAIPLATYLTDRVEVEAWDDKTMRWVPIIRAFDWLTGPEALQEMQERHIPHMRLQTALVWESQPEHRGESLPPSSQDVYRWRIMEGYPFPVMQVIHGPAQDAGQRTKFPAHYFRFKPSS